MDNNMISYGCLISTLCCDQCHHFSKLQHTRISTGKIYKLSIIRSRSIKIINIEKLHYKYPKIKINKIFDQTKTY